MKSKPVIDIREGTLQGLQFGHIGADIKKAISAKIGDKLAPDVVTNMNKIEKLINEYDNVELVGLIVALVSPEKLNDLGRQVLDLAKTTVARNEEASTLATIAKNLEDDVVYVMNLEQVERYGLDV